MNPIQEESQNIIDHAELIANEMIADMDGPTCIEMVRSFCQTMIEWQPNIAENKEEPLLLSLHCLAAASLFSKAFTKAYAESDGRVKAQEALDKVFNS